MNIRAIAFTDKGQAWQDVLGFPVARGIPAKQWAAEHFASADALLFIGACGIAVRTIAPLCRDKTSDPAVLVMDEAGRHIIPLLSGHLGGANRLAMLLAEKTGAEPVITTATDLREIQAADTWAVEAGCAVENKDGILPVSAAMLSGRSVGVAISEREMVPPWPVTLWLRPRTLVIGIGCKKDIAQEHLEACIREVLHENALSLLAVRAVASIDVKREERAICAFAARYHIPFETFTAEELNTVPGIFSHSDFVHQTVGCGCVCERAAVKASGGVLLLGKTVMDGVTIAIAGEERL